MDSVSLLRFGSCCECVWQMAHDRPVKRTFWSVCPRLFVCQSLQRTRGKWGRRNTDKTLFMLEVNSLDCSEKTSNVVKLCWFVLFAHLHIHHHLWQKCLNLCLPHFLFLHIYVCLFFACLALCPHLPLSPGLSSFLLKADFRPQRAHLFWLPSLSPVADKEDDIDPLWPSLYKQLTSFPLLTLHQIFNLKKSTSLKDLVLF